MAKIIMIQGTMSNAGKSLITAGLCRVFAQDGYRVAPFKSQNMALNSYVTASGLEMGRAQVMQAEAAGIEPCAEMNPILLKPTSDTGSQVVVMGKARCNMGAAEYYRYKTQLIPDIKEAFAKLEEKADIIVIEGAGSPAEVNLKQNDIVNMGLAKMLGAPVLLAGDIDRGGVFAQLLGTLVLLDEEERNMIKGLIINKFRGDKTLLDPGIRILEEKGGIPVAGVLPYTRVQVDDEDSLSERLETKSSAAGGVQIAVVRLPHISNFTDFNIFEEIPNVHLKYISTYVELQDADMVILPGSKNTIADLRWLQERGLAAAINRYASSHPVFGICGGFQMLGKAVHDPYHTEEGGSFPGLDLLPVETVMQEEKTTVQCEGVIGQIGGIFKELSGMTYRGYEIHTGQTGDGTDEGRKENMTGLGDARHEPVIVHGNVYGSYIHGLFDYKGIAAAIAQALAKEKGIDLEDASEFDHEAFKQTQYDILADMIRNNMDMEKVYAMLAQAKV